MESFTQWSQDKNKIRVRSPEILNRIKTNRMEGYEEIKRIFCIYSVYGLLYVVCSFEKVED
jgi:hypothetical protein